MQIINSLIQKDFITLCFFRFILKSFYVYSAFWPFYLFIRFLQSLFWVLLPSKSLHFFDLIQEYSGSINLAKTILMILSNILLFFAVLVVECIKYIIKVIVRKIILKILLLIEIDKEKLIYLIRIIIVDLLSHKLNSWSRSWLGLLETYALVHLLEKRQKIIRWDIILYISCIFTIRRQLFLRRKWIATTIGVAPGIWYILFILIRRRETKRLQLWQLLLINNIFCLRWPLKHKSRILNIISLVNV